MEPRKTVLQKRELLYIILIIGLSVIIINFTQASHPQAALEAKKLYEIRAGDTEILKTEEISGLYEVSLVFSDDEGRRTLQDVYVTKDGQFILAAGSMVILEDLKKNLIRERTYAHCLEDAKVVIFGSSSDEKSLLQLQALGITSFASKVFFDCSQNADICRQVGISSLPTTVIGSETYLGVQSQALIEEKAGCAFG
ncbi:MAG: hypothetical protein HY364_02410 [Candidatus Aenigmarchaeota archaeon]|nr:hypothetical protein [Candidatus Aenigmarchaeota archaeon]